MNTSVLNEIRSLPVGWHGAGTATPEMLAAIADHCSSLAPRSVCVETGAGKTTLLFSHLFQKHQVFAFDAGGSVSRVRESGLLNPGVVTFIDGPTQLTLPKAELPASIDCVLLDGPHGYPFPDLEYYWLYPRIRSGGLLILDDVHIPTIRRMLEILRVDPMWEPLTTVGYTAFLRRTSVPMVDPFADDWWKQGYNRAMYEQTLKKAKLRESSIGRKLVALKRVFRF